MEVRASQGPQQAGRIPINALSLVRPVDVRVQSVRPVVCVRSGGVESSPVMGMLAGLGVASGAERWPW